MMRRWLGLWLPFVIVFFTDGFAFAADGSRAEDYSDKRVKVALTIGISHYRNEHVLANPLNDVAAVSRRLKEIGFDVVTAKDSGFADLRSTIDTFLLRARGADIALIYYSGHGLQINGENYMVPSDFVVHRSDVFSNLVSVTDLLTKLDGEAKAKIILLDACRSNPFIAKLEKGSSGRTIARGLAPIPISTPERTVEDGAYGLIVGYATQPDDTADDGEGSTSPYAAGLLAATAVPDEDVSAILVKAARKVFLETNGAQRPEHRVALTAPLFLVSRKAPLACDVLAAETDNNISVKGVSFDEIDVNAAIPACRRDLAGEPNNIRLMHNLARALDHAGQKKEAIDLYKRAAEGGWDWSQNNLAVMYMTGDGVAPDFEQAMVWMRKAYAQGNRQALVNYADTDMSSLFVGNVGRTMCLEKALTEHGFPSSGSIQAYDDAMRRAVEQFKAKKGIRGQGMTFQVMDELGITSTILRRQADGVVAKSAGK